MSGDDDFLSRWSRRKLRGEEDAPEPVIKPDPAPAAPAAADDRPDEEILAELGLKHPDLLQPGDDIRGFMQVAVPDRLRRMALRQLWRAKPELAVLDGLVEYGEDFTDAATVIANLQTAYQVGKGMLWEPEEAPEEGKEAAQAPIPEPDEGHAAATDVPDAAEPADVTADSLQSQTDQAPDQPEPDEAQEITPTRRRMAFRFEAE